MAGNYPDVPDRLFPVDLDGTSGFGININQVTPFDATAMANLVKTSGGNNINLTSGATSFYMGYVFPQLRDIAGFCLIHSSGGWGSWVRVETSANTTNGTDGAWTDRGAMGASGHFRTITTLAVAGVKGIRFRWDSQSTDNNGRWASHLHVYGSIPLATSPDRLTLWHPTLDQQLPGAALDFGDVTRSSTADKTFRVKNLSATLTANSIGLSMTAPNDSTPPYATQYTISSGGAFGATATIASLAAGEISAVCTLRLTTLAAAALTTWRQRLVAVATTWS